MKSRNPAQIAALNELIEEARLKLESYNEIIKPILDTEIELARRQHFFKMGGKDKEQGDESALILALQQKIIDMKSSAYDSEKLDSEIKELFIQIEKLETKIFGQSDRSSPSFLQKKQI